MESSIPAGERYRVRDAEVYIDADTLMYDTESATCYSDTDAQVRYEDLGVFEVGRAECQYTPGFGVCDRWIAKINQSWIYNGYGSSLYEVNMIHIIRHELGHTIGEHHPGGVNAMSATLNVNDWNYFLYLSHERTCHINRFISGQSQC